VRRWLLRLVVVVAFVAGGAGIGLLAGGGGSNRHGTTRTATVVAAPPATTAATASTTVAAPAPSPEERLAARLPLDQAVAQLFLVSSDGHPDRDWGGIVVTRPARRPAAARIEPFVAAAPDAVLASLSQPTITTAAAAQDAAAKTAGALKRAGVNMTLGPSADVAAEGSPVADRAFRGGPEQVAALTGAALDGFAKARVIAAVGSFPGEGGASADPDQQQATVGGSLAELRSRDLIPFTAVAARAPAVVVSNASYAAFDGVTPATLLPAAIGGVLRGQLHFGGVVVSGDLEATVVATNGAIGPTAVAALRAGCDLLDIQGPRADQEAAYRTVLAAARSGQVRIRTSVQRVLALKSAYGLIR
jgi:beta-N-acetylhexosaminidase